MKRTTEVLGLVFIAVLLGVLGCSKAGKSDSATLQGTWETQAGGENKEMSSLVLSGNNLEFHLNTNQWYKGTFTLREDTMPKQMVVTITECPFTQYVGKTSQAIYQIENGALTIAVNEPGNPKVPTSFDDKTASKLVFKAK
jgi:uncharacterized protein (TIGR03067 family)